MRCYKSQPGAVLSFSGEDHQQFLQGQGTADLKGPTGFSRYSLWLDFKGNIMGDGFVLKTSESEMLVISDRSKADFLIRKFTRHIIADDVEISDKTGGFELISIPADSLDAALQANRWTLPATGEFRLQDRAILYHGRRLGKGTLQALVPVNSPACHASVLFDDIEAESFRIQSAVPMVPDDTDEHALNPLETNIISALSFSKGCYLGQEVVARVHRLGRVSRRLVKFESAQIAFNPGGFLHNEAKEVGKTTSVVKICDNYVAIGWLKSKIPDGRVSLDEGVASVQSIPQS